MFTRFWIISAAVASVLLLAPAAGSAQTLANGIHVSDLPFSTGRFELIVGYQAGIRNENRGFSGLTAIIANYLASTVPARTMQLAAYASGGDVEFFSELDRTAMRISVPEWAKNMIVDPIADYLGKTLDKDAELFERARTLASTSAEPAAAGFRSRVEDELRIALLGSHPYHHPFEGWKSDLDQLQFDDAVRFFNENYGTDRAFVLTSSPLPEDVRQKLASIGKRTSRKVPESPIRVANAERLLRFASQDASGAVIVASPVPGVFYRQWYSVLMLDRLLRRAVPGKPATSLIPSLDPYVWRLSVVVPQGQFAEPLEEAVLQEINRQELSRARPQDLEEARADARAYLESRYVHEWFFSEGIEDRWKEGLQWIASFTADDMRSAARDILTANRAIALWSPKAKQTSVEVELLTSSTNSTRPAPAVKTVTPLGAVPTPVFPPHSHAPKTYSTPERLSSGIWLAESAANAVFLAGAESSGLPDGARRDGPNGSMWSFENFADANAMRAFQKYRADRILVLATPDSLEGARSLWTGFKGSDRDSGPSESKGQVPNIDLPAMVVLKAYLDRKLIEAGWWQQASIRIDATVGAALTIDAPPEIKTEILNWIHAAAGSPLPDADFAWTREVAAHHLNGVLPDVQSLLWQRVHDYILPDLDSIAPSHLQNVAKLYF